MRMVYSCPKRIYSELYAILEGELLRAPRPEVMTPPSDEGISAPFRYRRLSSMSDCTAPGVLVWIMTSAPCSTISRNSRPNAGSSHESACIINGYTEYYAYLKEGL